MSQKCWHQLCMHHHDWTSPDGRQNRRHELATGFALNEERTQPVTPVEHYRQAENLLHWAATVDREDGDPGVAAAVARAHVHALLATVPPSLRMQLAMEADAAAAMAAQDEVRRSEQVKARDVLHGLIAPVPGGPRGF